MASIQHLLHNKKKIFRGGVIIKKQENFGVFQNREGGGPKQQQKSLKSKFGHLKTHGWGLNFSKMSKL